MLNDTNTEINGETTKYLIYKASGGLAHNLSGLTKAINFSNKTKRRLIIDTINHYAFGVKYSVFFKTNFLYDEDYENIPKDYLYKGESINTISKARTPPCVLQGKVRYYLLNHDITVLDINNNEDIIIFTGVGDDDHINKDIQINEKIMGMLEKESPISKPYISIHFRNTDKANNIELFIEKTRKIIDETNIDTIYLASDDFNAFNTLKEKFPQINIIRKTIPPNGIRNLHYTSSDKFKQLYDSIVDIYYITKSSYFLPSYNSGFSRLIINLINGKNSFIPDIICNTKVILK
jgi:hypothetical protein